MLHDAKTLEHCIPGAQRVSWLSPNVLRIVATVDIGPLHGSGDVRLHVENQEPPSNLTLAISAQGSHLSVQGHLSIHVTPNGSGSVLAYAGTVSFGGLAAPLDNPLMRPVLDRAVQEFLTKFEQQLGTTQANQTVWEAELPEEVAFWKTWINEDDLPGEEWKAVSWKEERRARFDPSTPLQHWAQELISAAPGATVRLLDVGAGPVTQLGKLWPDRTVRITAIDPLANEYNELLDEARIIPPVRTRFGHGETLTQQFSPNTFDFVCAINALDHSYDPLFVIQGMVDVVKPGSWVKLIHFVNEAEAAGYTGLHQWNFALEEGEFVIWSQREHIRVRDRLHNASEVRGELSAGRVENGVIQVSIRKRLEE